VGGKGEKLHVPMYCLPSPPFCRKKAPVKKIDDAPFARRAGRISAKEVMRCPKELNFARAGRALEKRKAVFYVAAAGGGSWTGRGMQLNTSPKKFLGAARKGLEKKAPDSARKRRAFRHTASRYGLGAVSAVEN